MYEKFAQAMRVVLAKLNDERAVAEEGTEPFLQRDVRVVVADSAPCQLAVGKEEDS